MGRMYNVEYIKNGEYHSCHIKACNIDTIARYLLRKKADKVINVQPIHRRLRAMYRTDAVISSMHGIRLLREYEWLKKQPNSKEHPNWDGVEFNMEKLGL